MQEWNKMEIVRRSYFVFYTSTVKNTMFHVKHDGGLQRC